MRLSKKIIGIFLFVLTILSISGASLSGFKQEQLRYSRVREAYQEKQESIEKRLNEVNVAFDELELHIRIFKLDKRLEIWGRNRLEGKFVWIESIDICSLSGDPGPKRRKHDLQIPEGFYQINAFNPTSNYHLSLSLNYPNHSDRILGEKGNLGGSISIHGSCITVGCVPVTDDKIKTLYVYAVEAKNNGQSRIPVTIFPMDPKNEDYKSLREKYEMDEDISNLWTDLEKANDLFLSTGLIPKVRFLDNGRHTFSE